MSTTRSSSRVLPNQQSTDEVIAALHQHASTLLDLVERKEDPRTVTRFAGQLRNKLYPLEGEFVRQQSSGVPGHRHKIECWLVSREDCVEAYYQAGDYVGTTEPGLPALELIVP